MEEQKQRAYILAKFQEQGDFSFMEELPEMVDYIVTLDDKFMEDTGVTDGDEVYDDDKAYEFLFAGMNERFPARKMYLMRFVEDYMDYAEDYLESIGAIEWE